MFLFKKRKAITEIEKELFEIIHPEAEAKTLFELGYYFKWGFWITPFDFFILRLYRFYKRFPEFLLGDVLSFMGYILICMSILLIGVLILISL